MVRYAIYYAPRPTESLAAFARGWLGYDAEVGSSVELKPFDAITPELRLDAISEPSRYGFHATLKAPFALAAGAREGDLLDAVRGHARDRRAFDVPLHLDAIGHFLALVPVQTTPAVTGLAADCVRAFDPFRAPLDEAALARRRAAGLTGRQEEYLQRWGYPYVLEEFRFHLTLTGPLGTHEREQVRAALLPRLEPLCAAPATIRDLVVFVQPEGAAPFRVLARFPLAG